MSNDNRHRVWSPKLGVVGSAACILIAACFSANRPLDSTQTGNPPVIDAERVALRVSSSEVHVLGEPGAVEPGGATVEVTNLMSGMTFTTKANADGSFDLEVSGSPDDTFSVRARSANGSSSVVYVIRGTAAVGNGQDGSLSCEQRNTLAGEVLTQTAESADRDCATDMDCQAIVARASCYAPACTYAFVSELGRSVIEGVSRGIESGLCVNYEKDGCDHPLPKCPAPPAAVCLIGQCGSSSPSESDPVGPSCNSLQLKVGELLDEAFTAADKSCIVDADCVETASRVSCWYDCQYPTAFSRAGRAAVDAAITEINATQCAEFDAMSCKVSEPGCGTVALRFGCVSGQCELHNSATPLPDCGMCLDQPVSWGPVSSEGVDYESSTLEPCVRYTRIRTRENRSVVDECTGYLGACDSIASVGAVSTALAHADVTMALNSPGDPVLFGNQHVPANQTPTRDNVPFQVTIGMHQIILGGSCEGAPPNCIPVPAGLTALKVLLQQIDQFEEMSTLTTGCAPASP
jgi:hypothetical protein